MNILKVISDNEPGGISLGNISAETGIEKSTCSHILETLCAGGYAYKISQSRGYKLGPATYCLTRFGKYEKELITVCRPILRWLAEKSGGITILAVIDGGEKYIIDYVDRSNAIFKQDASILTDDIYRTATGRIILSHMSEDDLFEIYKRHGIPESKEWEHISSYSELRSALEDIRSKPYVFTSSRIGEHYNIGFGQAIKRFGRCVGAVGIAYVSDLEMPERSVYDENVMLLDHAVKEITKRLEGA